MRWTRGRRSRNVEDRRSEAGPRRRMRRGGTVGLGGILVLLALSVLFRQNFLQILDPAMIDVGGGSAARGPASPTGSSAGSPEEEELAQFVSFVLDDNQETWTRVFPELNRRYEETTLVLFRDVVQSACGLAESATGPFYCPGDQKVYIDLGFYDELRQRFGAPGDFAQAYVISHEIGHHVQHLLGIDAEVRAAQSQRPRDANDLSVRMELQADCFAGVWGHSTAQRNLLERGDVEEGLNAAAAIGDDRIQRMSRGTVNPDGFTHGSSEQRVAWFRRGMSSGDPNVCDTFAAREP